MIVTVTMNPSLDKSTTIDRLVPEKKMRCSAFIAEAGGGGVNVSKALRELGIDSCAVFPAGGNNGAMFTRLLEQRHVTCSVIAVEQETRENFSVMETSTDQQFRFVLPGTPLGPDKVEECFRVLKKMNPTPTIIVGSGSLPPGLPDNFYAQLSDVAQQLGARYLVDTSGTPLQLALHKGAYLIKPNLSELARLVGKEVLELNEVEEAAKELIRRYPCEIIVVSLGSSGALMVSKERTHYVPAPTVRRMSTIGAGDSAVAGMTYILSKGGTLSHMARFGVACGTAATMNPGTELFRSKDAFKLFDWINRQDG